MPAGSGAAVPGRKSLSLSEADRPAATQPGSQCSMPPAPRAWHRRPRRFEIHCGRRPRRSPRPAGAGGLCPEPGRHRCPGQCQRRRLLVGQDPPESEPEPRRRPAGEPRPPRAARRSAVTMSAATVTRTATAGHRDRHGDRRRHERPTVPWPLRLAGCLSFSE